MFEDAEVISRYTREQAINDGVLVDVTSAAKRHGLTIATALTSAAWHKAVAWDQGGGQSVEARLDDVLMLAVLNGRANSNSSELIFLVGVVPNVEDNTGEAETIELKMSISGGDNGEPVVTIMLPDED